MASGEKRARVYFRRDGKRVLIVSVHPDEKGGFVEGEGPLSLTTWDDEALGESIATALDQSTSAATAPGGPKMPGAATLKISGEPSPRSFDSSFILIQVTGASDANPDYLLQGRPDGDLTLTARLWSDAPPVDLARQATRIFQICRDRRF